MSSYEPPTTPLRGPYAPANQHPDVTRALLPGKQESPAAGEPRLPRRRTGAILAGGAALALFAGGVGGAVGAGVMHAVDNHSTTTSSDDVEHVAAAALPSVVTIRIADSSGQPIGTGSGFVLRSDGYLVTNNHVASAGGSGEKLTVMFSDGSEAGATVVGSSAPYDLAVLKVDRSNLPALQLGDSSALTVGSPVIAVGAPLGLTGSVTTGIVSALNRPVVTSDSSSSTGGDGSYINAIQTDAAINHGNSGGPLLDMQGRVIGVNSAIASTSQDGGSIGLGFAIPAEQVKRTTDQLIRSGKADYPVVGIEFDPDYAGDGIRTKSVAADSPAQKAGIKEGDIITSLDGEPIKDQKSFVVALRSKAVGQTITLGLRDGDRTRNVTLQTAGAN
ncbi:S1C family serine protease [Calidifontibacter terrae]